MSEEINVTIENKLVTEKREMNIYHQSTGSAHMISHNSSVTLPLRPVMEDDYLHISIVSGPGRLGNKSIVNLPSWADFEFSSRGNVTVIHSGGRTLLEIPPGPPAWEVKMTRSSSGIPGPSDRDRVIIGDGQPEYR